MTGIGSLLYNLHNIAFGHSERVNQIRNHYSENDIRVDSSANIGRFTRFYGDIDIAPEVSIAWNCTLRGTISVGKGTNMNGSNKMIGNVSIGKYCAIAPRARIRTTAHPTHHPSMQRELYEKIGARMGAEETRGSVSVGNDVWICADSKILSDVTIGDGAIIAANSVVVDDVEPYSFVAGNPAQHKKYRFDEDTRDQLREIKWWDWSNRKIRENTEFFEADLREVDDIGSLVD